MRDGSDRCLKSITLYNELILNELKRKVIDSRKMTFKKITRGNLMIDDLIVFFFEIIIGKSSGDWLIFYIFVISTKLSFSFVISTKRSAWRDLSTHFVRSR